MNQKVFIRQDGSIPGHRIIEELVRRGAKDNNYKGTWKDLCYYIDDNKIKSCKSYETPDPLESYTELIYNKETDSFYEKNSCSDCINSKGCINCNKEIEKPLPSSACTAELLLDGFNVSNNTVTYLIPEGYEAKIENGKVIVKKKWTIKDAKPGDILSTYTQIFIFQKLDVDVYSYCYCWVGVEPYDGKQFVVHNNKYCSINVDLKIATQEEKDLLFHKMGEAGYEWDEKNLVLKKKEINNLKIEIDGTRHRLVRNPETESCSLCSLDKVCDRFKDAICTVFAGKDGSFIFQKEE